MSRGAEASAITRLEAEGYVSPFPGYPAATAASGLLFLSGVRGGDDASAPKRFDDLPVAGRALQQGYFIADMPEAAVAADAWQAHVNLDHLLTAGGSEDSQIVRQHIWQKDKRFFPVYETTRMHWQKVPPPSSGVGITSLPGLNSHWYGITGIASRCEPDSLFGPRRMLTPFDNKELPSASFYSQAVATGPLAFLAGHIPIKTSEPGMPVVMGYGDVPKEGRFLQRGRSHPDSRDGPIAAQAWFTLNEIARLLRDVGSSMSEVVMLTVFLQDLRDFPTYHRVHRHFFPEAGPALCVMGFNEVGHRGTLIEIEPTVLLKDERVRRRDIGWDGPAPFAAPAAVAAGPFVFFSGMLGYREDGTFPTSSADLTGPAQDLARQAERYESTPGAAAQIVLALERLRALTAKADVAGLEALLKMCVCFYHPGDLQAFEAVRNLMGWTVLPASDFVAVPGPGPVPQATVQIEAIGYAPV